jgi:uncharacterized Zn-binding protein involved in type VI secretion
MPPAARISDMHTCPMVNPGPVPHVGGPDISGSPDVIVGFMPQARVGDSLVCVPAVDSIAKGSPTVLVNGRMAARIGDSTVHGGVIVAGCPTVLIGETGQGSTLKGAAADGTPFCEECEKAKKALQKLEETPAPNDPPPGSADVVSAEGKKIIQSIKAAVDKILPEEKEDRERLIRAIKPLAEKLIKGGKDDSSAADWARTAKASIMKAYDVEDHWDVIDKVYERNEEKFGDKLGPSIKYLVSEKGKTAREIIDAAATGNLKEKLTELKPEIIDRVAEKLIENETVRGLVVAGVNGNLKEKLLETKDQLIDKVVADHIVDPKVGSVVAAALKGDFAGAKSAAIDGVASTLIENEQVRSVVVAAAQGNIDEAKSLATNAIIDQIPNEQVKGVVSAIANHTLPDKLSEMSQAGLDKFLDGVMDAETKEFAKPLLEHLKAMLGEKVSSVAGGLV